jgi:hypothetical protein
MYRLLERLEHRDASPKGSEMTGDPPADRIVLSGLPTRSAITPTRTSPYWINQVSCWASGSRRRVSSGVARTLSPTAAPQLTFEPALDAQGLQRVLAVTIEALKCAQTSAAWWKQKHQRPVADRTMFDRALSPMP